MAIDTIKATAILDGAVDTADLADDAVTNAKIDSGAVDTTELADDAVTTDKITDGNVTVGKLASTLDLSSNTVTLPDTSVTNGMLANSAVTVNGTSIALGGSETIVAGKILQAIENTHQSTYTSSGTAWTDIMSVSITPSSTTSKVFLLCVPGSVYPGIGGHNGDYYSSRFRRLISGGSEEGLSPAHNTNYHAEMGRAQNYGARQYPTMTAIDSPSTTSSITYKMQFQRTTGSGGLRINDTAGTSVFIAMEVEGS